jgi:cell division septation protein DedD
MDDKIFIKENEPTSGNNMILYIGIAIALVVLLGVGILLVSGGADGDDNSDSSDDTETVTEDDSNENGQENNNEEATVPPVEQPVEPTEPVEEPVDDDNEETSQPQGPPADESKLNVYFPSGNNGFEPVLRDKPDGNIVAFIITEILRGPSAEERNEGLTSTWQFTGNAQCENSNATFQFQITGTTANITMCKDFSGSDISKYERSLELSLSEQTEVESVNLLNAQGESLD